MDRERDEQKVRPNPLGDAPAADVVIVGAGILGCSVAVALGSQGRRVMLLERSLKEPNRIVGELLQPGGVAALEKLGIRNALNNIDAVPVLGYEVIYHGDRVHIPYQTPTTSTGQPQRPSWLVGDTSLPEGRSFHHGRFVQNLRAAAQRTPNVTIIETTVKELIKDDKSDQVLGVQASLKGKSSTFLAPLTIIADGHASNFRKESIKHKPVARSNFWGIILEHADLPRPNHGHVVVGNGGPILLYQISPTETRMLIDVPKCDAEAAVQSGGVKAHIYRHVLASVPQSVKPMFQTAFQKGGLRCMPNEWLPPSLNRTPGMIVLGDALNMRHPLTGGGMTVAINDAVLLSELLSPQIVPDLSDTAAVLGQMKKFHWQRKKLDSVINILAQALYSLFSADGLSHPTTSNWWYKLIFSRSKVGGTTTRLLPIFPIRR